MAKPNKFFTIAITSGDQDGVGPEVTAKALAKLGPQKDCRFVLWRSPQFGASHLRKIDKRFRRVTVSSWPEALKIPHTSAKYLIDICSPLTPPRWVEAAAQTALLGTFDALVTAPLSKTLIAQAGLNDVGHTDIFSRLSGRSHLFMAFLGSQFHVVLMTGHLPLKKVPAALTSDRIQMALAAASSLAQALPRAKKITKVRVLGLNPHSGEEGLIGSEEQTLLSPLIQEFRQKGIAMDGPLVPDAAFTASTLEKGAIYVAPYHDQGLIPFKMAHSHSGCHITLGLPFLRTSVDHGTAKDLFGRNKADASSMQNALKQAIVLCRQGFKADSFISTKG